MDTKTVKTKITKTLKQNGFVKSTTKNNVKSAGFEYMDFDLNKIYVTYYISDKVFSKEEREVKIKQKIAQMYEILSGNMCANYKIENHTFQISIEDL